MCISNQVISPKTYTSKRVGRLSTPPIELKRPNTESGYWGVYRTDAGRYRAKIGRRKTIGTFPDPVTAAWAVVEVLERDFGDDWPLVLKKRACNLIIPKWSQRKKAWVAYVWAMGNPVEVAGKNGRGFGSADEAKVAGRMWVRNTFGLFAGVSLWRMT